jgi:putative ABC transport system substrate-binding protein
VLRPRLAAAQGNPPAKIGYAYVGPEDLASSRVDLILNGVRASGHALPRVELVMRVVGRDPARLAPMVKEVLDRQVSVFIAAGPASLRLASQATRTLPIVAYDFETDPVAAGYAQSIARPGGNVTGIFLDLPNFSGKWMELLRACIPTLQRVAVVWDPSVGRKQADSANQIIVGLNMQADLLETNSQVDFEGVFAVARDRGAGAMVMLSSPLVFTNARQLAALALRYRLPAITMFAEFARGGGLISYGPSLLTAAHQAGFMAGKVLAGTSPADLPIERPSKFELLVNSRSAEALSIKIPASIQALADEVIE